MKTRMLRILPTVLAAHAAAQPVLYGVRANGNLLWINSHAGATQVIGSGGVACNAAAAFTYDGGRSSDVDVVLTVGDADPDLITELDRWSGTVFGTLTSSGRPAEYAVLAMTAVTYSGSVYVLLGAPDPSSIDVLARLTPGPWTYTVIGPTGRADLVGLAVSRAGVLYALGTQNGGALYTLDPLTGAATLVGGGNLGDSRALAFVPDGRLLACGSNLHEVSTATGAATLLGPTGFADIQGLGAFTQCYVNCSTGGSPPVLNVLDFLCFINRFAAGSPYANCDESTAPPTLNVLDFMCFLNRFASLEGC